MKKIYQVFGPDKTLNSTWIFKEDAEKIVKTVKGGYIEELNF